MYKWQVNILYNIHSGDLPANHEVLREVSSLCDQLPVLDNKVFDKDFCSVSGYNILVHCILTVAHVGKYCLGPIPSPSNLYNVQHRKAGNKAWGQGYMYLSLCLTKMFGCHLFFILCSKQTKYYWWPILLPLQRVLLQPVRYDIIVAWTPWCTLASSPLLSFLPSCSL